MAGELHLALDAAIGRAYVWVVRRRVWLTLDVLRRAVLVWASAWVQPENAEHRTAPSGLHHPRDSGSDDSDDVEAVGVENGHRD